VAVWPPVALLLAAPFASALVGSVNRQGKGALARRTLGSLVLVFVPAGLIAVPWFWRNWRLYNDPLGLDLARQTIDQRLSPWLWADSWWLVKGWFLSFWGRFGAIGQIAQPAWMDWLLLVMTLISAAGLLRLLRERRADFRFGVAVLLLTVASVALVMWRYSLIALGTDQGRLFYPALGPLVGLWVLGLITRPDRCAVKMNVPAPFSLSAHLSGLVLVAATALWSILVLAGVIVPAYSPAPVLATHTPATDFLPITFGEIQLIAVESEPTTTLLWNAAENPTQDWRTVLRVTAEDGTLLWEWQRSPGQGRYATDLWSAGTTVRDSYDVQWPEWAGAGRYRVEVGMRRFDGGWALPMRGSDVLTSEDHPFAQVGWVEFRP